MSSIEWTAVAYFLYAEVFLTLILILPLLSASTWKGIFRMKLFSSVKPAWKTLFFAILLVIIVLFGDSVRTMVKYGGDVPLTTTMTLDAKLERNLRQCRGQRNFYITGFCLFLMFVIYRLITLLSERATLEAKHEAAMAQARNASRQLEQRLQDALSGKKDDNNSGDDAVAQKQKTKDYLDRIRELEGELKTAKSDRDAMKSQSESLSKEYDRVCGELQRLQKEGDDGSKKEQ